MKVNYEGADKRVSDILTVFSLFGDDLKVLKVLKVLKAMIKLHVESTFLEGRIAGVESMKDFIV